MYRLLLVLPLLSKETRAVRSLAECGREDFLSLVRGSWDVAQDLLAVSDSHEREKERRINFRRTRDEVGPEDDELDT